LNCPRARPRGRSARALRAFNDHVRDDRRVDLALLSIGEGLTLLRKI
jgi:predicted O-methyltransferase YrrM